MKFRTDFVTNSSSSSFTVKLTVRGADGSEVSYEDRPYWEDGGEASFNGVLCELSTQYLMNFFQEDKDRVYHLSCSPEEKERMKTVTDGEMLKLTKGAKYNALRNNKWVVAYFIGVMNSSGTLGWFSQEVADHINAILDHPGIVLTASACKPEGAKVCTVKLSAQRQEGFTDLVLVEDVDKLSKMLMNSATNDYGKANTKKKQRFIDEMKNKFSSPDQIESISVLRDYFGWGEGAQLIPENDQTLRALSERVIKSDGEEKQQALQEMRDYITEPNAGRQHDMLSFGRGYSDFRYAVDTDNRTLYNVAKRICSRYGPRDVSGIEYQEIRFPTGESKAYAEFSLKQYTGDINESEDDIRQELAEQRKMKEDRMRELKNEWMNLYGDVLTPDPYVVVPGHIFVFAGFYDSEKEKYEKEVTDRGGYIRQGVSGKTDYLVICPRGTYREGRIDKALEQQAKGKYVQIILPEDLEKALRES